MIISRKKILLNLLFIILLLQPSVQFCQSIKEVKRIGSFQKGASFSRNESGMFFILDKGSNEILKIDSTGAIIKRIGGTGWDDYTFDNPADLAITMLKVYVTDRNNSRIQVYDTNLNFLFSLDPKNSSVSKSSFKYPVSATATPFGDVYIVDSDNKQILKFNSSWEFVNSFGNYEYGQYSITDPKKIVSDNNGNIYLLDGKRIISFDQFGNGISIRELPEKAINLHFSESALSIIFDNHIFISKFVQESNSLSGFERVNIGSEDEIKDAIQSGGNIYILTENTIIFCRLSAIE